MPPELTLPRPTSMTARATLHVQREQLRDPSASRIAVLRSHAPLVLRPTHPKGPEPWTRRSPDVARVCLAAGAAGPLGGDDYRLEVRVGAGSTLVLNEVSATLLLPGPHGGRSRMRISVHVEDDATLIWLPEPIIAAAGCDHVHEVDVNLGERARLLMREELLLGRLRERPGRISQRLTVRRAGHPLYVQRLDLGGDATPWQSPAITGGRRCVGNVLVVDPSWMTGTPPAALLEGAGALSPLAGPAVIITAVADDTRTLRRMLVAGVDALGDPWSATAHTRDREITR